jgi:methenyltetrahydrofolate cyclohydrolase
LIIGERPLEVARLAQEAAENGNMAAVSDAGVAVLLAHACAESAALNVKINLKSIRDQDYNKIRWSHMQDTLARVHALKDSVLEATYRRIG